MGIIARDEMEDWLVAQPASLPIPSWALQQEPSRLRIPPSASPWEAEQGHRGRAPVSGEDCPCGHSQYRGLV